MPAAATVEHGHAWPAVALTPPCRADAPMPMVERGATPARAPLVGSVNLSAPGRWTVVVQLAAVLGNETGAGADADGGDAATTASAASTRLAPAADEVDAAAPGAADAPTADAPARRRRAAAAPTAGPELPDAAGRVHRALGRARARARRRARVRARAPTARRFVPRGDGAGAGGDEDAELAFAAAVVEAHLGGKGDRTERDELPKWGGSARRARS